MEKELNIAAILKDKPKGTKLYSPLCGEVLLDDITPNGIFCKTDNKQNAVFMQDGTVKSYGKWVDGECLIFPSKSMRSWEKFAWKKGDVLTDGITTICIFDSWSNAEYTEFNAEYTSHIVPTKNATHEVLETKNFVPVENNKDKQSYFITAGMYFNVNLTKGSLEIEKPEFKDGDIITQGVLKGTNIYIIKTCTDKNSNKYDYYARYNTREKEVNYNDWSHISPNAKLATIEEIRELFIALDKDGKAWDADKKAIVDLPKKCEFKAFDKVLVNYFDNKWIIGLFVKSNEDENSFYPYRVFDMFHCQTADFKYCIPYNDQTAHLLGTTDDWKGGEG